MVGLYLLVLMIMLKLIMNIKIDFSEYYFDRKIRELKYFSKALCLKAICKIIRCMLWKLSIIFNPFENFVNF